MDSTYLLVCCRSFPSLHFADESVDRVPPGARYDPIGPGDGPPNLRGRPRFPGGGRPPNPFGGFGSDDFL